MSDSGSTKVTGLKQILPLVESPAVEAAKAQKKVISYVAINDAPKAKEAVPTVASGLDVHVTPSVKAANVSDTAAGSSTTPPQVVANDKPQNPALPAGYSWYYPSSGQVWLDNKTGKALPLWPSSGVSASDFIQGSTGDCFFMSSMAAAAQSNPSLVQNMIKQVPNQPNLYQVRFYDTTQNPPKPVWVTVDNSLPADKNQNLAGASIDKNGEGFLGAALIEKAFAVFDSTYHVSAQYPQAMDKFQGYNLLNQGGTPLTVLSAITGNATLTTTLDSNMINAQSKLNKTLAQSKLADLLKSANTQPVVIATPIARKDEGKLDSGDLQDPTTGLYYGHAYTVAKTYVTTDSNGNSETMVVLRNPWGVKESGDPSNVDNDGNVTLSLSQLNVFLNTGKRDTGYVDVGLNTPAYNNWGTTVKNAVTDDQFQVF